MERSKDELAKTFDHFDADDSGLIDREEFEDLMESLDPHITEEEIEIGFSEIDLNHNGQIERDEFISWWRRQ